MSAQKNSNGLYSVANIRSMFRTKLSKSGFLKLEEKGTIPKAERIQRGSSAYRAWNTTQLPRIGREIGYMQKPKTNRVISVYSLKGGTGKTTLAYQFARTLALHDIKTLIIGLDAQESITRSIDYLAAESADEEGVNRPGIYQILREKVPPSECICSTDLQTLFYIPESTYLSAIDRMIKEQRRKEYIFQEKILEPLKSDFDIIVFDANPAWTETINNALVCSDVLISPMSCDITAFKATYLFLDMINEFSEEMKHSFSSFFLVPTLLKNNKISKKIEGKYRNDYEDLVTLSSIRESVSVHEAMAQGKTMLEMRHKSSSYSDFVSVFKEIMTTIND